MPHTRFPAGAGGPKDPTLREQKVYKQEYREGAILFDKALHLVEKANNPEKKEMLGQVMEKAMLVLNQSAQALKNEHLKQQNEKIEKDFIAYKSHPGKEEIETLSKDLEKAKKSLG